MATETPPTPPPEPPGEPPRRLDDPGNVRRLFAGFALVCGLLFAIDLLDVAGVLYHKETHTHPLEHWVGFYAVYGFLSCVAIIEGAKLLRRVVMRDERYYERLADGDAPPPGDAPPGDGT